MTHETRSSELAFTQSETEPRINTEFLEYAFGERWEASDEAGELLVHLGLQSSDPDAEPASLAELTRRLVESRLPIETIETLVPSRLASEPPTKEITKSGLYNRGIFISADASKYTQGLERELDDLATKPAEVALSETAVGLLFTDLPPDTDAEADTHPSEDVIDVVPLNDEQRAAVKSGLSNPLTVVTGPPGTGKSQVVLGILANGYLRGERVLFSSKNNKAVDVVETRLNALSSFPLMVRAGGRRDLRAQLIDRISQAASLKTTAKDKRALEKARLGYEKADEARDRLRVQLEEVAAARNSVEAKSAELDALRDEFQLSNSEFDEIAALDPEKLESEIQTVDRLLGKASKRGIRKLMQGGGRAELMSDLASSAKSFLKAYPALPNAPEDQPSEGSLDSWVDFLENTRSLVPIAVAGSEVREKIKSLKSLPRLDDLAAKQRKAEAEVGDHGLELLRATVATLGDRLGQQSRKTLQEYGAVLKKLFDQQKTAGAFDNRAFAQLKSEEERLWRQVSKLLPIWCVTNLSARGALPMDPGAFDLVVIDEASQCDIPSALPLLYRAKRALVIGDPNQIRHVATVRKHRARELEERAGLNAAADQVFTYVDNSLFDLAASRVGDEGLVSLYGHYRSREEVVKFSSENWYGGRLEVCTDYTKLNGGGSDPALTWTQVAGTWQKASNRSGGGVQDEAKAVADEVIRLITQEGFGGSIGAVTPFRSQANAITQMVSSAIDQSTLEKVDFIADTAHGFQGDERDLMLFSICVANNTPAQTLSWLGSQGNLFNVALTRARGVLHVFGDRDAAVSCGVPHIEGFARDFDGLADTAATGGDPAVGHYEPVLQEALADAGLTAIPQHRVNQYRIDLAFPEADPPLAIEIDGEEFHTEWDGSRLRSDQERDIRLMSLGWRIRRYMARQVRDDTDACVKEIKRLVKK